MNYKIYDYQQVHRITLDIYSDGHAEKHYTYHLNGKETIGKRAYVGAGVYDYVGDNIRSNCKSYILPDKYPLLFVSPASKISRDALRNGGYKITYDKTKANCVVVPRIRKPWRTTANLVYSDGEYLTLYDFRFMDKDDEEYRLTEKQEAGVKKFFEDLDIDWSEVRHNNGCQPMNVFFVQKCDEYKDVLNKSYGSPIVYCQDVDVCYDSPNVISPETLLIWRKMKNDLTMFEKVLVTSDWKEYPMTVCLFVYYEITRNQYRFGNQGQMVLDAVNFDTYDRARSLGGQTITPKDWNMLQSYLMLRFGVSEKGGLINGDDLEDWEGFLKHRMAIIPTTITEDIPYKDVVTSVHNHD